MESSAKTQTVVGISGSLRRGSFNTALLRASQSLMPDGTRLQVRTLEGIPLYNGDDEAANGLPAEVADLKEAIASAAGLIIATPEYNNAMPGVLKNAIDWVSRPASDIPRVFGGRPVALMGTSPGGSGTVLAQNAWLPVLRYLGCQLWTGPRLALPRSRQVFGEDGGIVDDQVRDQVRETLAGFARFVAAR